MNSNLYLLPLKGDELMRPSTEDEASGWSKANKVCSDVTPSLCVMGERRGL
jgi:hypothetical protein